MYFYFDTFQVSKKVYNFYHHEIALKEFHKLHKHMDKREHELFSIVPFHQDNRMNVTKMDYLNKLNQNYFYIASKTNFANFSMHNIRLFEFIKFPSNSQVHFQTKSSLNLFLIDEYLDIQSAYIIHQSNYILAKMLVQHDYF